MLTFALIRKIYKKGKIMKRKILALTFAMAIVVGANAQSTSTYTPITRNDSDVAAVTNENNLKLNDEYLKWQS